MMDFVNRTDYYSMVPDEIFVRIFGFSPVEDRKSIRLTCRRFYELCDDTVIQSAEVIALRGTFNTVPALHCLSKSSRRIQNIKLCRMHLNSEIVVPFFEQHGSHLRSLSLMRCSFDRGALKIIIENCTRLRQFAVHCFYNVYETIVDDFEELAKKRVVRGSVTDFSFIKYSVPDCIRSRKILHFFAVFPKISRLNLDIRVDVRHSGPCHCTNDDCQPKTTDVSGNSSYLFSCLYDRLLTMADQLEELHLHLRALNLNFGSHAYKPINILNTRMKNLKRLSFSWFYDFPDLPSIHHSSLLERLTHFNCSIHFGRDHESLNLVVRHLLQFTSLRSLILNDCEVMDRKLFAALVQSKLTTLEIRHPFFPESVAIRHFDDTDPAFSETRLRPNYCLQRLVVDGRDRTLASLFATYFRRLEHLKFTRVGEADLQNIFKDQTRIRSLHLCNFICDEGFKEVSYFQGWLRKETTINRELKYLTSLRIQENKYALTSFLLNEFVFSKLRKLTIIICSTDEHDAEQLYRVIPKLTHLQSLSVDLQYTMTYPQWLTMCKSLTELRHFEVANNGTFHVLSEYLQLFDVTPSLRSIKHKAWSSEKASTGRQCKYFIYDVMERTVVHWTTENAYDDPALESWGLRLALLQVPIDVLYDPSEKHYD